MQRCMSNRATYTNCGNSFPKSVFSKKYCCVEEDHNSAICYRAQEIGQCPSMWKILRKDLGLHAYKIQSLQELKPGDHRIRRDFVDCTFEQLEANPLLFSGEARFCLSGFVSTQNCRIWGDENPSDTDAP